jgi:hypothetical protein
VRDAVDAYRRRRDVSGDFINILESFARALGGTRLGELDEAEVMDWARGGPRLRASGRTAAPRTVQGRLKAVKAVLRLAEVKMRWPVPDLDLNAGGLVVKQEKWLTAEERDRLLAAFDPLWRSFATTLFMTGARPVELGRLTWCEERQPPCPVPSASLAGAVAAAITVRSAQSAPFWLLARLSAEVVGATTALFWRRAAARRR